MSLPAPFAERKPQQFEHHGDIRTDEYHWLRSKESPAVIAYLEAENIYTKAMMADTEELQKQLNAELIARIEETDQTVPAREGPYLYYTRTEKGKQYSIYCRRAATTDGLEAPEEIVLDGNELAIGHEYFSLGVYAPSPDHQIIAYGVDTTGEEEFVVRFKDMRTGKLLADEIRGTSYSLEWANDGQTLFYNTMDATRRPHRIWRHMLGRPQSSDQMVFEEKDERFTVGLIKTRSHAWILIDIESATTTEYWRLHADHAEGNFELLYGRRQDIEYDLTHQGDSFYVRINDRGRNFRLAKAPAADPRAENWVEVIPHRPEVLLESATGFANHLVLTERENGLRSICVIDQRTGESHRIAAPEPVYHLYLAGNAEYEMSTVRFEYTSLVTPPSVFDYDMDTRERRLRKQAIAHGYDPSKYVSERIWATSADGTKVPVALVHRRGLERDGSNPTMLYGYGSYGLNVEASFNSDRLSLIDRGWIWAIAQIRGGSELGEPWHDHGKMLEKKNTFADFIAAAETLVAGGYTKPEKLAIMGRSAGGLLIGTVLNERPDLFGAAIAGVPFVDVINTMLDTSLPLTVGEFEEWGNPAEERFYAYMKSFSPYDNVRAQRYPNLLVTAGLNDPRVQYWEPAKWVARLRAMRTDTNLLLLKTEMGAGHFGPSGRYERFKETAFEYAFLLKVIGEGKHV